MAGIPRFWFGLWFVVLYLLGIALTTYQAIPSVDQPLSALRAFYADPGNRFQVLIGGIALVVAGVALLIFVVATTADLTSPAEVERSVARLSVVLFAGCTATGGVALGLIGGELALRTVQQPGPEIERWLAEFGYAVILLPGMAAAATLIWALTRSVGASRPASLRGLLYGSAVLSACALPIAILTGTLLWSQIAFCCAITLFAVGPHRETDPDPSTAGHPTAT